MNKKGFIDTEIITNAGFVILVAMAVGATVVGYVASKKMGWTPIPVWQLIVLIIAEIIGSYLFVARG